MNEAQASHVFSNVGFQVEIFVNRMKSNSSRGRPIANDSSVQVDKKINDAAYC
jgi:growth factor-regulated tyrosine kinase substrate